MRQRHSSSDGDTRGIPAAVQFLASPAARFVTGQTLVVDGGLTITDYPSQPWLSAVGAWKLFPELNTGSDVSGEERIMTLSAIRASAPVNHWQARVDLAAAFRLAAQMDWHRGGWQPFSLAVSDDGRQFLLNPRWRHFTTIRASELLLVDSDDAQTMQRVDAPDPLLGVSTGICIAMCPMRAACCMCIRRLAPRWQRSPIRPSCPSIR
jgi:hypothetical protein